MAAPTYYPLWATEDTNLPATDNTNKERPKDSLQTTGWDKGQIPSAEEMNWMLNNIYLWIQYLNEEALPTYLPITGTTITLSGEVTGTATFAGDDTLAIATTVPKAVTTPTASSIVRRDTAGVVYGSGLRSQPLTSTPESLMYMLNSAGTACGIIASTQTEGSTSGYTYIRRITPSTQASAATIQMFDAGYITLNYPRTNNSQETVGNALLRYDTHSSAISTVNSTISSAVSTINSAISTINSTINSAVSTINSAISTINATMVTSIRLGTSVTTTVGNGNLTEYGTGYVVTMGGDFGADDGYYRLRPLQYYVNGTWYTAGYA